MKDLKFGIIHNNINVKDLDKSLEFYQKSIGYERSSS